MTITCLNLVLLSGVVRGGVIYLGVSYSSHPDRPLVKNEPTLNRHSARLGGDELAILLSDGASENAQTVMRKVHHELQDASRDLGLTVSISIGVATFQPVPETVQDLLRAADRQMCRVKQKGKNNLEYELLTNALG